MIGVGRKKLATVPVLSAWQSTLFPLPSLHYETRHKEEKLQFSVDHSGLHVVLVECQLFSPLLQLRAHMPALGRGVPRHDLLLRLSQVVTGQDYQISEDDTIYDP